MASGTDAETPQMGVPVAPGSFAGGMVPPPVDTKIVREPGDVPEPRRKLVKEWQDKILADKEHWKKDFDRMRENMQLAYAGAKEDWAESGNYVVPIIMRHINMAVAALYAKNPTATAQMRKRLYYKIWDGTVEMVKEAMANPMDPNAMALLQEIDAVKKQQTMIKRVGKTLETLFHYYMNEPEPNIKLQVKQMLRRAKVCAVGYVWYGFQRNFKKNPDITAQIEDLTNKLATMERIAEDIKDDQVTEGDSEIEVLRSQLEDLKKQENVVAREGPVLDFPQSTEIVPSKKCKNFAGFIGAPHLTREYHMTVEDVKEIYKIDVSKNHKAYAEDEKGALVAVDNPATGEDVQKNNVTVWVVFNKALKQTFTIVEGYPDFVEEPATPKVYIESFWPCLAFVPNAHEHYKKACPLSDVYHLRHPQREYNLSRQGLREHRQQNRPMYVTLKGAMEEQDRKAVANPSSGLIIELAALQNEPDINKLLQKMPAIAIDPALYETKSIMEDVVRVAGSQDAQFGQTTGGTATESTIAENSRQTTNSSITDDLDEFLSSMVRTMGQIMLYELSPETVMEIAGPGAVWPTFSREDIAKEVYLEIRAGSSGRPNQAADLAKMERAMPYLLQMPGINPIPLAEKYATLLELDVEEMVAEGVPSIMALNAMMAKAAAIQPGSGAPSQQGGDPMNSPEAQGAQGNLNGGNPQTQQAGPQPAMPA